MKVWKNYKKQVQDKDSLYIELIILTLNQVNDSSVDFTLQEFYSKLWKSFSAIQT